MKHLLLFLFCSISIIAYTQDKEDEEFTKVLTNRSEKIIEQLNLSDKVVFEAVTKIMVNQYKSLAEIHDTTKDKIEKLKKERKNKEQQNDEIEKLENLKQNKLFHQYCSYIGALSAYLNNDQIEKIKDGMTYGVLPLTYKSFNDMIPSLKEEEKKQLYAWLAEAREHAINESSSKDKHAWFGKYKGRFNNYLSERGYDLQAERKGWEERLKNK